MHEAAAQLAVRTVVKSLQWLIALAAPSACCSISSDHGREGAVSLVAPALVGQHSSSAVSLCQAPGFAGSALEQNLFPGYRWSSASQRRLPHRRISAVMVSSSGVGFLIMCSISYMHDDGGSRATTYLNLFTRRC
jgi:hypothetical protein